MKYIPNAQFYTNGTDTLMAVPMTESEYFRQYDNDPNFPDTGKTGLLVKVKDDDTALCIHFVAGTAEQNFKEKHTPIPFKVLGDYAFPTPVRQPLDNGTPYFVMDLVVTDRVLCNTWCGDDVDLSYLERGLVQLTKSGAEQQAYAVIQYLKSDK